ncbi:MAG: S-layer homology domain-containing protein [Firmicutes bacterium]|nr:S-layer homology domain-containing protein [Bacillota bacterium]
MKKTFKTILASAAAVLALSIPVSAASGNLLVNPGAENGVSGWVDENGTWKASDYWTPYDGGYYFFAGANAEAKLYQDVDISDYSGGKLTLGAYLGGDNDPSQTDESILELQFLGSGGNDIGDYSVKRTNGNDWKYYEISTSIPQNAVTARVILHAIRHVGSDNDGYFDKLSLTAEAPQAETPPVTTDPVKTDSNNLLKNPSAEDGINYWTDKTGTWSANNYWDPYDGGYYFFAGVSSEAELYQDVNISQYSGSALKLSGYLGGDNDPNQTDESILQLQYLGAGGNDLGTYSVERTKGNAWNYYELTKNIPQGAVTARVILRSVRHVGNDNDGYFDGLSLTVVSAVAESVKPTTEKPTETTTQKVTEKATEKVTQKVTQTETPTPVSGGGSNTRPQTVPFTQTSSEWAQKEMQEAYEKGLIPDVLIDKDLRENVSRAEFASIAVTLYEELSGSKAPGGAALPFNDMSGVENYVDIQKAYGAGIAVGTSETTFAPYTSINREQLVTMLCRAIKKYRFPEWTIATDADYLMTSGGVSKKFADDADISDFARDSVYFMSNLGIVKGIDDTHFAPKAITDEQAASGYAIATREQAIAISLRIFKRSDMM